MSIRRFLAIVAVSVFLIGTLATANAFAEGWKPPVADHEARIGELETNDAAQNSQLADHETSIGDAEARLGVLEQNQADLQSDVADNAASITALESLSLGAALGVSDANDVFVGHLVDFRSGLTMTVFNPNIPAHFKVVTKLPPFIEPNILGIIAYDEAGCSGQIMYAGIDGERHQFSLMYDDNNDNYYVFDNAAAAINQNDTNPTLKSCFWIDDDTCHAYCGPGLYAVLKPVTLPPEFETLAYPITVRPIQQP